MELKFTKKNRTLIVFISGEIDHHTAEKLRTQTDQNLERMKGKNIIFCLQEVDFMDSSGIGVMIGRYKNIQSLQGRIAVACAGEKIQEILSLSGLGKLLPSFANLALALDYVEGRGEE